VSIVRKLVRLLPFISMVFSLSSNLGDHEESIDSDYVLNELGQMPSHPYLQLIDQQRFQGSASHHQEMIIITADNRVGSSNVGLTTDTFAYNQFQTNAGSQVLAFTSQQGWVRFEIESSAALLYELHLDYFAQDEGIRDLELAVMINGDYPFPEAEQVTLAKSWTTPTTFAEDRYQNQIMPRASLAQVWQRQPAFDAQRLQEQPLLWPLEAGINTLTIYQTRGQFLLGHLYLKPRNVSPTYSQYLSSYPNGTLVNQHLEAYQAEHLSSRNSLLTRFTTNREPNVTPFALIESKLNVIDGATYQHGGQAIAYQVEVPTSGFYFLTWKVLQNRVQTISYRRLKINGEVPFAEANTIPFPASRSWQNRTLGPLSGDPYRFYLPAGIHTLTLEVNVSQTARMYAELRQLMEALNELSLAVKKITGNTIDPNREWDLRTFMPNLEADLSLAMEKLVIMRETWMDLNQANQQSDVIASLNIAYRLLAALRTDVNLVPRRLSTLSGASGSVLYRLGIVLPLIIQSPLTIDQFYVHGQSVTLPRANATFLRVTWIAVRRFFASFFSDQFREINNPNEVIVWVSRSRQYVNLLQQMADAEFTPVTGIPVRIQINPNEDKLILASSANKQPDIAMGIAGWRPYDFAIRNNVYDLTTFPDFRAISDRFYPGSFLQLIYQDGVYGLPETQNFYLLFYREDIMNRLNLNVPNTWQDVIGILPELQRFGLNFYSMLSSTNAFKAYVLTMPFIRQYGGEIFSNDALRAGYDDPKTIEALTLMTDLYTTYSLPVEVGSFYNEFRYGRLPIGIGDFGMYISLLHAAPEIAGLWNIAPLPGQLRQGVIDRSFDGSSTSAMMFKNTTKASASWSFLKWWTSAATQLDYAENLISAYGPEYLWNSSNREAFSMMSWDEQHRETILDQWQWIYDTAKTPASYMVERELSNIWNKVVFQGVNLRTAIEDSLIISNKEIRRKMIEFGFMDRQGNPLKPYVIPTKEHLDQWIGTSS
jgi:ABC-type glycerol-3-phosphate transport system substrate-binding protein